MAGGGGAGCGALLLLLLLLAAAAAVAAAGGGAGPLTGEGAPGVDVVAPLAIALAQYVHPRCIFLLYDDAEDDGLEGARARARLRRRLAGAGAGATMLPFRSFEATPPRLRCPGRALQLLLASDDANARFLTQVSVSEWGAQDASPGALHRDETSCGALWLLFVVRAPVSTFFASMPLPFDVEVLAARQYRSVTELTEVWRVAPGQPLRDATWGRFARGVLRHPSRVLFERRGSLAGAALTVVTGNGPPFTLVVKNPKTNKEEAAGYMGEIWKTLQNKMNFTTRWVVVPEPEPIERTLDVLAGGGADVALMDYTLTMRRLEQATFSTPVLFSSYSLFVGDGGYRIVNWMSYLEPFRPELWAVELLTLCTLAVSLAAAYHAGRRVLGPGAALEDEGSYTLYNSLFYVFGAFCMQGHDVTPRSCALRVVYLVAYLTSIILMAAYSAALISFLAVQATALPFADVAGLLDDGRYAFATVRNSSGHQFIKESHDPLLRRLVSASARAAGLPVGADPMAAVDALAAAWPANYLDGLKEVCRRRLALLAPQEYVRAFATLLPCAPIALPGFRLRVGMAFAVAKHCPFRRAINHNLDLMRKSGALSKLLLDARALGGGDAGDAGGLADVDLGDVAPLLAALAAGTLAAALFLCAERLLYRRRAVPVPAPALRPPPPAPFGPLSPLAPHAHGPFAHLAAKNKFLV